MKLRSNTRTDWPLKVPVFKHSSFKSLHIRLHHAFGVIIFYKDAYPAYVHRAVFTMVRVSCCLQVLSESDCFFADL